ncbi:MAG TPA: hypothetical protein VGO52_23460 [Hyphomonadaceae bacterium]|jgi:hypothetical protein|nr:hypothetical protein [Hyphomonadaceae bacterium]
MTTRSIGQRSASRQDQISAHPADLPEALTLRPSPLKWFALFLGSLAFTSFILQTGKTGLMAWGGLLLFGGGIPLSLVAMFGIGTDLRLDREGFTVRTIFRAFHYEWANCSAFEIERTGRIDSVIFSVRTDEQKRASPPAKFFLHGPFHTLPDTYGRSPEKLAALMNAFRDRALA